MAKSKPLKMVFRQDWGTYDSYTIVFVGYTTDEMKKWIEKNGSKDLHKAYLEDPISTENNSGMVWYGGSCATIMYLEKFDKDWRSYDILVHECLHLVQFGLVKYREMADEFEAQAYMLEYLTRNIRQYIHGKLYGKK